MDQDLITQFKETMSNNAQMVSIVTSIDENDAPCGVTISSVVSFSVNPPMILISLNNHSQTRKAITLRKRFIVHALNNKQQNIAKQFAAPNDRFHNISLIHTEDDLPLIAGCTSATYVTAFKQIEEEDHTIIIGKVEKIYNAEQLNSTTTQPLIYHQRQYKSVTNITD